MNEKLNGILNELVEIQDELDELYKNGEIDVVFIKGEITEARFRLEAARQTILRGSSQDAVSGT